MLLPPSGMFSPLFLSLDNLSVILEDAGAAGHPPTALRVAPSCPAWTYPNLPLFSCSGPKPAACPGVPTCPSCAPRRVLWSHPSEAASPNPQCSTWWPASMWKLGCCTPPSSYLRSPLPCPLIQDIISPLPLHLFAPKINETKITFQNFWGIRAILPGSVCAAEAAASDFCGVMG